MSQRSKYAARPITNGSSGQVAQAATVEFKRVEQALNDRTFPMPGMDNAYNAAAFPGVTDEAKITRAIAQAKADGVGVVWIPTSMRPYDASLVTFDSAVHMMCEGGSSSLDAYDATAYGASGTQNATYDYPGVQAAVNVASANVDGQPKKVKLPGKYMFSQPVIVTGDGVAIEGMGRGRILTDVQNATYVTHSFADGPIFALGAAALSLPLVSSLIGGSGNALDFTPVEPRWFNFRDASTMELHGLTTFCVECFYKPTATALFYTFAASSGRLLINDTVTSCFKFGVTNTDQPFFTLKTSSGTVTATAPVGSLVVGTTYHIAGTYDGSNVRIYVAAIGASSAPTVAAQTGTLVQGKHEDVTFGVKVQQVPEGTFEEYVIPGYGQCPRVSNVARYTGTITAPSSELANDANTLIVMPCVTQRGFLTQAANKNGVAWLAYRQTVAPSGQSACGVQIRDMEIFSAGGGTAIYAARSAGQGAIYERLNMRGVRRGLYLANALDGFWWTMRDCHLNTGTTSLYGIAWNGSGGIALLENVQVSGFPYGIFGFSGSTLNSVYCLTDSGTSLLPLILQNDGTSTFALTLVAVDTESGVASGYRAAMALGGSGVNFSINGFGCGGAGTTPNVILSAPGRVSFDAPSFSGGTATSIFNVLANPSVPVAVWTPRQTGTWIPWSDVAGTVVVGKLGKGTAVTFSATPTFDCSLRDAFEITLTANCAPTVTNITPGQPIKVTVKQDGTGGWTFTWPANVKGGGAVSGTASSVSQQCFTADLSSASVPVLYADAPMVVGM